MIRFNSEKYHEVINYEYFPVFNLIRVRYETDDENWLDRLFNINVTLRIVALNEQGDELASVQEPIVLGEFISPNHRQPIVEINKTYRFSGNPLLQNIGRVNNWQIEFQLNNIELSDDEALIADYIDSIHIKERVEDWKNRVHNVIERINGWLEDEDLLEIRRSRMLRMEEGLMKSFNVPMQEVESADIYRGSRMIMALKPFGLWVMGANGRIDLLTSRGNFVLIDQSEQYTEPQWKLHQSSDRRNWIDFNKEALLQILQG